MPSDDFKSEVEMLVQVLAQLDDRAYELLKDFVASGQERDKEAEKKVQRARRAVQKAIADLKGVSNNEDF